MTSVSARLPEPLKSRLDDFMDEEKLDKSTAVRKLISDGLDDWNRDRAVRRLEEGEISFSKAADEAEMTEWRFAALLEQEGADWVDEESTREDLEDL